MKEKKEILSHIQIYSIPPQAFRLALVPPTDVEYAREK
jgi:hypothetical protein